MIDQLVYDWAPVAIAAVIAATVLDWTLTHAGAKAYRRIEDRWAIEGSYELNPAWEREIDSGQGWSRRFASSVAVLAGALTILRVIWSTTPVGATLYAPAVGAVLLLQTPILMAHVANLQTFRDLLLPDSATGHIRIHRWLAYRQSTTRCLSFAVLWLALGAVTWQAFFLGGAISCAAYARRFSVLGSKARAVAT